MKVRLVILLVSAIVGVRVSGSGPSQPTTRPTSGPDMVPLTFKLPQRPYDVREYRKNPAREAPNAEYPSYPNIRPLLVPLGTVNLARKRPVKLSDDAVLGKAEMLTDDNREALGDCFVEMGRGLQWVQVDLENSATIHAIALWRFSGEERVFFDTVVQISDSPEFDKGVTTVFNNSLTGLKKVAEKGKDRLYIETEVGRVIAVNGVRGRYVRVWSNGNTLDDFNQFVELEVHGIADK